MKVPSLNYDHVLRALQRDGWIVVSQKGSHIKYCNYRNSRSKIKSPLEKSSGEWQYSHHFLARAKTTSRIWCCVMTQQQRAVNQIATATLQCVIVARVQDQDWGSVAWEDFSINSRMGQHRNHFCVAWALEHWTRTPLLVWVVPSINAFLI